MNEEIKKIRSRAILLCPNNDSEAYMILSLAKKAGISTIQSKQPHGAKLELEKDLDSKISSLNKKELWVVEIPGVEKENGLRKIGFEVKIIDHHTYNNIDRLTDLKTGLKKPSSLEQFIELAQISDEEIQKWGFEPKTVRGIGIMDARYIQGLREDGYSRSEIDYVLKLQREITKIIRPDFYQLLSEAEKDWDKRIQWKNYTIIKSSNHERSMRSAISEVSITKNMDAVPMIISIGDGEGISVQNVSPEIINKLKQGIKAPDTYSFGSGRCWGIDNRNKNKLVTLEEIMDILK